MTILLEGLSFHKHFFCLPGSEPSLSIVDNNQAAPHSVSNLFYILNYVIIIKTMQLRTFSEKVQLS